MANSNAGRPTVMDSLTLSLLDEAFSNDANDIQACFLANISPATLYRYQEDHPEYCERKKALKAMVAYQAKINVKEKIVDGDIATSMWLLPKKEKAEYSERQELTGKDGETLNTTVNITGLDALADSLEKANKTDYEVNKSTKGLSGVKEDSSVATGE